MRTDVHGSLLNLSDLARSLGVSPHTVAADLDVLEQTFLVRRLPPWHANVRKRLTKSPKLYLRDTGLLHLLAGLRQPRELSSWSRRGASVDGRALSGLKQCMSDLGLKGGFVVYTGDARRSVTPAIELVPWEAVARGELDLPL